MAALVRVSRDLPPTLTQDYRGYSFWNGAAAVLGVTFDYLLVVRQGKGGRDVYGVDEPLDESGVDEDRFPPLRPFPRWFVVEKIGGDVERDGPYLVRVSQGAGIKDECQCFGYNRWQHCKHIAALSDLVKRGDL